MLFNSLAYAIFLPIVFILYWFVVNRSMKLQHVLLLASSYFFYACWDWRFLFLLIFSTFLDYFTGLKIERSSSAKARKIWLFISIFVNLGFLGFFKYYNFFAGSLAQLLQHFNLKPDFVTLKIILPVGISFYTFHGLSYVLDIYNKKIRPTTNWIEYSLFVSFFPLLVAGPIERATHLLPQVEKERKFSYSQAVDGLRQILWGLFKKVVIADSFCAGQVNAIFNNASHYSGSTLAVGALLFTFQIYGDFSGYSDIALGSARLFGFELLQNFKFPYFSRDIAEFWRRWHISLSSWFRDYLYIPLGGSKGPLGKKIRNVFIIFLVSGFWHGANWTFIAWGALNALFIMPSMLFKTNRNNIEIVAQGRLLPSFREALSIILTFCLTVFAWIFFRSPDIPFAFHYISGIFSRSFFQKPEISIYLNFIYIAFFMLIEWLGREQKYAIENIGFRWHRPARWLFYCTLFLIIIYFSDTEQQFIYFQF